MSDKARFVLPVVPLWLDIITDLKFYFSICKERKKKQSQPVLVSALTFLTVFRLSNFAIFFKSKKFVKFCQTVWMETFRLVLEAKTLFSYFLRLLYNQRRHCQGLSNVIILTAGCKVRGASNMTSTRTWRRLLYAFVFLAERKSSSYRFNYTWRVEEGWLGGIKKALVRLFVALILLFILIFISDLFTFCWVGCFFRVQFKTSLGGCIPFFLVF